MLMRWRERIDLQEENCVMKAYVVITAKAGTARDIADAMAALPGVQMADACWGGGDVYAVVEFPAWKELNALVLDKVHSMPGVIRTETHVAVER
jgi:DNA-binding Lrp family transcriptional regulator